MSSVRHVLKFEQPEIDRLLKAAGFNLSKPDREEVRFRLNALAEGLSQLDDDELRGVDPLPLMTGDEAHRDD